MIHCRKNATIYKELFTVISNIYKIIRLTYPKYFYSLLLIYNIVYNIIIKLLIVIINLYLNIRSCLSIVSTIIDVTNKFNNIDEKQYNLK